MAKNPSEPSKAKMLPSHEIYNRVIWDKRLNPNAFVFGYTDRLSSTGIKQKPLVDWDTNGDIPWHRIRYILCKNTIVWDRDQHIDKFSSGELPNEAWQLEQNLVTLSESESVIAIFSSQSIYHQDLMGWQVYHQGKENILIDSLSIVTFNVLSDMYEADKIYTNERIPIIVEHLKNSLADIIILQEVTKPLFNQLLKEDWIKDYFTSEAPEAPSLAPQNLVIFSKFPFTLVEHWHSPHKRSFVASWQINDNALHLAAVHLISNRANKAEEVRATQIATLLKYLATLTGDCIIAGDFNVAGNEHDRDFLDNGFEDIWKILKAKEIGYTFDPELNPLAKLMSLQGKQARFDRVLLRSKTHNWQAKEIAIFACKPFNKEKNLFASDHFALKTVLRNTKTNMLETISPIYQSAIVIIPPKELWPNIQAIRKLYDKKIDRWMPHITLIYGFIPEEYFQQASELILQALSKVKPFTITLNGFKTFSHRKSSTAWLEPLSNPEKALVELQATLQSLFPKCNEQSNKPSGFTPHLSVGQFENPALAQKLLPSWEKIEFQVNTVALISRRGDQPFEVCYKVALGKNLKVDKAIAISSNGRETLANTLDRLSPAITKEQKSKQEAVISIIKQACKESLGQEASLHLIGSTRLGVQNQTSDLDIICIIPETLTGQEFLSKIKDQLSGFYQQARIITNAQVPILKLKIDDILIDLLYVRSSLFPFSIPLNALSQRYFDQTSWQTLVGCLEADILLEIVSLYVELEVFRIFLRAIRLWARSRAILGNAWGFPGSFSWTILAAWSCNNLTNPKTTPEELLANFFNRASQHNWSEPIALTESAKKYHVNLPKDRLPIITSIKPNQNSARNISRSTAEIVKQELVLGAKILAQIQKGELGWDKLFEIPKLNRKSQKLLFINIIAKNTNDLENSIGWLEGHIFGLIINLEQLNITLRPWPKVIKQQTSGQIALELSTSLEKSDPKLNEILESFSKTFYTDPSYLKGVKIEIEVCLAEEKPL